MPLASRTSPSSSPAFLLLPSLLLLPALAPAQSSNWNFAETADIATSRKHTRLERDGSYVAALSTDRITFIDMSQPIPADMVLGFLDVPGVGQVDIAGRRVLYTANPIGAIREVGIVDFANPASPARTFLTLGNENSVSQPRWLDDEFTAYYFGLLHFTVGPANAITNNGYIPSYNQPLNLLGGANYLSSGTRMIVDDDPVALCDFSDPPANAPVAFLPVQPGVVHLDAEFAISTTGTSQASTLHLVDVTHPPHCPVVGTLPAPPFFALQDVDRDAWRLVACNKTWTILADISDPAHPTTIGIRKNDETSSYSTAVSGNKVLLAGEPVGIRVLTSTGPQQPDNPGDKWTLK